MKIFLFSIVRCADIGQGRRILKDFTAAGLDFAFPTQTILASVEQKTA